MAMTMGALTGLPACAGRSHARPAVAISGLIYNGVTSHPLDGAIVELDGRPLTVSSSDGRFRIEGVPVGLHLLGTRTGQFRARVQPVIIQASDVDAAREGVRRNDFIVPLFPPSSYFDAFPPRGDLPVCRTDADCPRGQICLMNNFREIDAPACAVPRVCATEADCAPGQQCEPVTLASGEELRVCHGQPAPEASP